MIFPEFSDFADSFVPVSFACVHQSNSMCTLLLSTKLPGGLQEEASDKQRHRDLQKTLIPSFPRSNSFKFSFMTLEPVHVAGHKRLCMAHVNLLLKTTSGGSKGSRSKAKKSFKDSRVLPKELALRPECSAPSRQRSDSPANSVCLAKTMAK